MLVARLSTAALDSLAALLASGPSLIIATRDADSVPEVCRCAAARLGADGVIRLAVPLPEGERSIANATSTRVIALAATLPSTYHGIQIKGRDAHAQDWPELAEAVEAHARAFTLEADRVGALPIIDRLWSRRFGCLVFIPEAIFDQTPGANAGNPISP